MKEKEEHTPHMYCEECADRVAYSTWKQNHKKCWKCNHKNDKKKHK